MLLIFVPLSIFVLIFSMITRTMLPSAEENKELTLYNSVKSARLRVCLLSYRNVENKSIQDGKFKMKCELSDLTRCTLHLHSGTRHPHGVGLRGTSRDSHWPAVTSHLDQNKPTFSNGSTWHCWNKFAMFNRTAISRNSGCSKCKRGVPSYRHLVSFPLPCKLCSTNLISQCSPVRSKPTPDGSALG